MVFFVLSGFLVGGSVVKELTETGSLRLWHYIAARVTRIHSVLVPALLLGGAVDWLGSRGLHAAKVYDASLFRYVLNWKVADHLSVTAFLGNLACLQTICVPVYGSNGPLWSLANEFWYYFLFPALLLAVWPRLALRWRLGGFLVAAALVWMLGQDKSAYFLLWLLGAAVRLAPNRLALPSWLGAGVFCATLIVVKTSLAGRLGLHGIEPDALVAAGFSVLLLSWTRRPKRLSGWLATGGKMWAGSSYTLYACHFPLAVFCAAALGAVLRIELPGRPDELKTWGCFLGILAVVSLLCWITSLATERRYHALRHWLQGWGEGFAAKAASK